MTKPSKIAQKTYVFMCDDVRRELGNKISLMGIYGDDIFLNKVPNNLKSLVFVLMLENLTTKFNKISINLKLPKDKPNELTIDAPKKIALKTKTHLAFGFAPVKIGHTGKAKVEFRFDDEEKPRIVYNFNIKTIDKQA